ncbi:ABC transporter permease [Acidobacterium sp. S8]|uniref:ABC transporter permease n=1 Tax=Acidobacterium sp. S8 TaxID=1641854 RepID=UPI00131DCB73|nr:permease prefix domain 1-containing protein [Acidobacterium sp. S8]
MGWLRQLFSRRHIYADLSEEIRHHLDETVEALIHEGMNRKDAEHAAKKKFGNATLIEERSHELWQWRRLESFWADLKYGLRQLAKAPGFSVTVIITIALGIGANAAIFNLMRAVVFPTLSVPNAKEMYQLRSISTPNDAAWLYSGPAFDRLRSASIRQADIAAHTSVAECNVFSNGSSGIDTARMQLVSTNFFSTLEVLPTRGRFLLNSDSAPTGGAWHAVLRFGFWQQHFASDPAIIGKSLLINGAPVVIIGVAPKQFSGVIPGEVPDLWLPLEAQKDVRYAAPFDSLGYGSGVSLSAPYRHQEALFWLTLIARVPRGLESSAIAAWTHAFQPDLDLAARFAPEEKRAANKAVPFTLHPLAQSESVVFDRYSQPVTVLMMMVAAVLLIACINLANLQRSRLIAHTHEFGVRASLGAGRGRILQQLLVESGLLTFIGGVTAVIIAVITGPILLRWASPGAEPIPLDLNLSADVYSFIAALLALTFFAFAFIPSFAITRMDLASAARSHRTLTQSPSGAFSNILLSSQVALSLLLLALASMFARTLVNLNHVDTGFDRQHILTVRFAFHRAGYTQPRVRALATNT